MASRHKGYGLTAEVARKKDSKYDPELARQIIEWINTVLGEQCVNPTAASSADQFHEQFKDGVVLLKLANALGGNYNVNPIKKPFIMMENIGNFLDFCDSLGVPKTDVFQKVDLYESQNIPQVINGLQAFARKAYSAGKRVPRLGPKEATSQPRKFTEEHLKQGQNVIGLQMDSNKLASQAGDHFGRPHQVGGTNVYK